MLGGIGSTQQAPLLPWVELTAGFRSVPDADILCDAGRHVPANGNTELLYGCDVVVVITRSTLPAVRATARLVELLRDSVDARPSLLVVDAGRPYSAAEIATACGTGLLGELPHDPRSAAVWTEGASAHRSLGRAPLARAARSVAVALVEPLTAGVTT